MNLKLLVGIVLFLIGIGTAVVGITDIGDRPSQPGGVVAEENATPPRQTLGTYAIPAIAGLSLAVGGLLLGLSLGNWQHPRTHLEPGDEIVDPEGYHKMKHV